MWLRLNPKALVFLLVLLSLASCSDLFGPAGGFRLESVESVFVSPHVDFGSDPRLPFETPPPDTLIDGLLYRAFPVIVDTALASPPMNLWMNVRVTNPSDSTATLRVRGCPVWPELYATPDRSQEAAWIPEDGCQQFPFTKVIAANDSLDFGFLAHDAMLGWSIPDGRYYLTLRFRRAADTLVFKAGSADVRLEKPGLAFRVSLDQEGDSIRASLTVENMNDVSVPLEFGACAVNLSLFRDEARTDLAARWGRPYGCPDYLRLETLRPGEAITPGEFRTSFGAAELGDQDLDGGRYFLVVELDLNWRTLSFPIGVIDVS